MRELVYVAMPVCSLLYGVVPKSILPYLCWIMIGAISMTFIILLYKLVRLGMDYFPRKKLYEVQIPELYDLADRLGYRLTQNPFWMIDKRNIKAKISREPKRVIFGKDFFNQLTSEEKIFVGGHEFFHLYDKQDHFPLIVVPLVGVISYILPYFLGAPLFVVVLGLVGSIILSGIFSIRSCELMADQAGLIHVGKEVATSALKKAYPGRTDKHHDFHPSIDERIKRL